MKIKIKNGQVPESNSKRLNDRAALLEVLHARKVELLLDEEIFKIVLSGKNTGKSYLANVGEIYFMEKDPMASCIGLRKYSTAAAKRLSDSFSNTLTKMRRSGFKFPKGYKRSQQLMYRLTHRSDMLQNQSIEYGSFEDISGIAGIEPRNGGYFAIVHIEEPIEADDDGAVPETKEWERALDILLDSVKRSVTSYNSFDPHFKADPTQFLITSNNWDDTHPISILAEKHLPIKKFLSMNLGGIDPDQILGNREMVLKHWDHIVNEGLLKNAAVKVKFLHKIGSIEYKWSVTRETKLANPMLIENKDELNAVLMGIQDALITNNKSALAVLMGMADDNEGSGAKAYNIHNFNDIKVDTKELIEKNTIVARSIGWDVDVNRRLTAATTLIVADTFRDANPMDSTIYMRNVRLVTPKMVAIPAYGRGINGSNTQTYIEQMAEATQTLMDKYPLKMNTWGSHLTIDNDQGTFSNGILTILDETLSNRQKRELNMAIQVKTGDIHGIIPRTNTVQAILDEGVAIIDKSNIELFKFIEGVKKNPNTKKRIEKGKYEDLADFMNAYEGSLSPFMEMGLIDTLITEKYNEEEEI